MRKDRTEDLLHGWIGWGGKVESTRLWIERKALGVMGVILLGLVAWAGNTLDKVNVSLAEFRGQMTTDVTNMKDRIVSLENWRNTR